MILYQPNNEFKAIFDQNENAKINAWIITGNDTDYGFLNQNQDSFDFKMSGQKEDYLASFDSQFNLFALDNIGFEQFPPLENPFGAITASGNVNVLYLLLFGILLPINLCWLSPKIKADEVLFCLEKTSGNGEPTTM